MSVPDISSLTINEDSSYLSNGLLDDDLDMDKYDSSKLKAYAKALPYSIEPSPQMMELLDFIIRRILQCVVARDYDVGLLQWDSLLSY